MPKTKAAKIILGLDPGLADTGFGVIEQRGQKLTLRAYGTIKTKAHQPMGERLKIIRQDLQTIIKKYRPELAAVEQLFFAKNAKTAMVVGQARGVIILTLAENQLDYREFTPLQVKMTLTNFGQAPKKQVQQMVKVLLKLESAPRPDDAADALAIAICASNSLKQN